jgi:hypothetical protein
MISWATLTEDKLGDELLTCEVTEEVVLHQYSAKYSKALTLSVGDTAPQALTILKDLIDEMKLSRTKDRQILFLALSNISRLHDKECQLDLAYLTALEALEIHPNDKNAAFRAAQASLKVGDVWTCRALLRSAMLRENGGILAHRIMLDRCESQFGGADFTVSNLSGRNSSQLIIESGENSLIFFHELAEEFFWRCDEVKIIVKPLFPHPGGQVMEAEELVLQQMEVDGDLCFQLNAPEVIAVDEEKNDQPTVDTTASLSSKLATKRPREETASRRSSRGKSTGDERKIGEYSLQDILMVIVVLLRSLSLIADPFQS